mgnify:CR=1 FL=1
MIVQRDGGILNSRVRHRAEHAGVRVQDGQGRGQRDRQRVRARSRRCRGRCRSLRGWWRLLWWFRRAGRRGQERTVVIPLHARQETVGHGAQPFEVDVDGGVVVPTVGATVLEDGGPHDLVPHLGLVRGAVQSDGRHVHHLRAAGTLVNYYLYEK